jgi:CDP-diglyceride synthetase
MLSKRLPSGIALIAICGFAMLGPQPAAGVVFIILGATALVLGLLEYIQLADKDLNIVLRWLTVLVGMWLFLIPFIIHPASQSPALAADGSLDGMADILTSAYLLPSAKAKLCLIGAFIILSEAIWRLAGAPARHLREPLSGLLTIALPLSFLADIYVLPSGPALLLFAIITTKFADVGGYAFGKISDRFMPGGNHKLVPVLSPKKSWEGLLGGFVFSAVAALILLDFLETFADWDMFGGRTAIILAVVFTLIGLLGDLYESAIKRAASVKDSASTIPGMGGVLDVLDSLILVGPVFCVFIFTCLT